MIWRRRGSLIGIAGLATLVSVGNGAVRQELNADSLVGKRQGQIETVGIGRLAIEVK